MDSTQWHVPVVTRPNHREMKFDLAAKRAVLINGSAISYAESTMGIIEHYHLAEIVGSTTGGTNGNVHSITGSALRRRFRWSARAQAWRTAGTKCWSED
jgi:hypothetical protein